MALVELLMPKMGESIMEATILSWLKKPGDKIELEDLWQSGSANWKIWK